MLHQSRRWPTFETQEATFMDSCDEDRFGTDDPIPELYHRQPVYFLKSEKSPEGRPSFSSRLATAENHPDVQLDESPSRLPG